FFAGPSAAAASTNRWSRFVDYHTDGNRCRPEPLVQRRQWQAATDGKFQVRCVVDGQILFTGDRKYVAEDPGEGLVVDGDRERSKVPGPLRGGRRGPPLSPLAHENGIGHLKR